MSTIKVQNIQHTASSTNTVALASDGTCTLASGSKLNNCTTDGTTNLTIADGNLVVGTSGHGIDFLRQQIVVAQLTMNYLMIMKRDFSNLR